jgi:hypothetical protein
MKATRWVLVLLLVCALPMFSCDDDDDSGDSDPTIDCEVDFCAEDDDMKAACEAAFDDCIEEGSSTEDECESLALGICDENINALCDEELCAVDEGLRDQCKVTVALCISAEPDFNLEECVAAGLLFCNE